MLSHASWQLRRRLFIESLEDRLLLASLYYWADGSPIELVEQTEQFAIRLRESSSRDALSAWLDVDERTADYRVKETLGEHVWLIEKKSPMGPYRSHSVLSLDFAPSMVEWATPGFYAPQSQSSLVIIDELIVGIHDATTEEEFFGSLRSIIGGFHYRPLLGTADQFVVSLDGRSGVETVKIANHLSEDPRVSFATPNTFQCMKRFAFVPNDSLFSTQWHLRNTAQVPDAIANADIKATTAWDTSTGSGVTIAIVDDGMERTHPDLIANIFVNTGEIAGNSIDDDGNGYVDDVSGWSFAANGPNPSVGTSDRHGTSVAGVAAAQGNNSLGVTGAAFNAKILPVQMFNGGTYVGDAGASSAIYYAAGRTANGLGTWNAAQVINCSWGGGSPNTALTTAFTWASNTARGGKGVATFIASGNDYSSTVSYPASLSSTLSGVMAVGASNHRDVRSEYSNYGSALDFVAPSSDIDTPYTVGITTTDRTGTLGYNSTNYTNNTTTNGFGGTSSASPLAAGVGALLLSANPTLSAANVKETLRATADQIAGVAYSVAGFNSQYGYGRINATEALRMQVIRSSPALGSFITEIPNATTGYQLHFNFSFDQDAADIDLSKIRINGISPTSSTVIDQDTLQFSFDISPVTAQGTQTMTIDEGAVKRLSDGLSVGSYSGTFVLDFVPLQVASVVPATNSPLPLPGPWNIDINFNEPVAASSVGTNDLTLTAGSVLNAFPLDADTVRYTIGGIDTEVSITITLGANRLTDINGLANRSTYNATYFVDYTTVAFPLGGVPTMRQPSGSLIYEGSTTQRFSFNGDTDNYTFTADSGQSVSLQLLTTAAFVVPRMQIFDPSGTSIGLVTGTSDNQSITLQNIPLIATGSYRVAISTTNVFTGPYTFQWTLNAATELEGSLLGTSNNTPAIAQELSGSFLSLDPMAPSVARGAVVGTFDPSPGAGYAASSVTPSFLDISTSGTRSSTAVSSSGTETLSSTQLQGFTFRFYGETYNSLAFGTNGLITFGGSTTSTINSDLSSSPSLATIAVLWNWFTNENTGTGPTSRGIYWQVVGSGPTQQLIVQWNNVRDTFGAEYFTFQAILSQDGSIQLNYASNVVNSAVSVSTVGVKAFGTSSPQRLLLSYNQAEGPLVGPSRSTRIDPLAATSDFYRMTLVSGDQVTLRLTATAAAIVQLEFLDADGTTVFASGSPGPTSADTLIANWLVMSSGTYLVRVQGNLITSYSLVVTKNAAFETEVNDLAATAQPIDGNKGVLGALREGASSADWYSFSVASSGTALHLETRTPSDGLGFLINDLDPTLSLYGPSGDLIASGIPLPDGRNESIQLEAPASGIYKVLLTGGGGTEGEYYLKAKVGLATVVNRQIFYQRALSFGNGTGNPISAIDPSKSALLPGQSASFANYTNYLLGLNGIVVDIANPNGSITASDFQFHTFNGVAPLSFTPTIVAPTIATIPNGGIDNSMRFKIEFPDNSLRNIWLRVTILANANTGLTVNDVFYFGNAVADVNAGNVGSPIQVRTNATDTAMIRLNQSTLPNSVNVSNIYDLNKDGRVNSTDTSLARQNQTIFGTITFFTAPVPSSLHAADTFAANNRLNTARPFVSHSLSRDPTTKNRDAYFAELGVI